MTTQNCNDQFYFLQSLNRYCTTRILIFLRKKNSKGVILITCKISMFKKDITR